MALFIVLAASKRPLRDLTWHVGEPWPIKGETNHDQVKLIQADGEELAAISRLFRNIPISSTQMTRTKWNGDIARFISLNMEY